MIITVSGNAASGKTTLARNLAKRLNFKHVSAGGIMREMASENKQDLIEFSKHAEKNPEVDFEIDRRQKKMAKGDCVVDGRLSAHFLEPDLSIWLTAPIIVRAKRIKNRDKFSTLEEAVEHIRRREASEKKRYKRIYGINHPQMDVYNIILDTSKFNTTAMAEITAKAAGILLRK